MCQTINLIGFTKIAVLMMNFQEIKFHKVPIILKLYLENYHLTRSNSMTCYMEQQQLTQYRV